jgi:hypothetical protein
MSRLVATAVLVSLWAGVAAADNLPPRHFVDLDKPGALEALQQSNPTHFDKIRQIIRGVAQQADANVPSWMLSKFNARVVRYAPNEMTTYPQRRLSFVIDDTNYVVVITPRAGVPSPG